jgi:hypothetical protein
MVPHAQRFDKWLRRRSPHAATPTHYLNDLKLFFAWAGKSPNAITLHDVDAYIPTGGALLRALPPARPRRGHRQPAAGRHVYLFHGQRCQGAVVATTTTAPRPERGGILPLANIPGYRVFVSHRSINPAASSTS